MTVQQDTPDTKIVPVSTPVARPIQFVGDGWRMVLPPIASGDNVRWLRWATNTTTDRQRWITTEQEGVVANLSWSPLGDLIAYEQSLFFNGVA
jgi:hypothetical protein